MGRHDTHSGVQPGQFDPYPPPPPLHVQHEIAARDAFAMEAAGNLSDELAQGVIAATLALLAEQKRTNRMLALQMRLNNGFGGELTSFERDMQADDEALKENNR
jgi:hypothetical protein